MAVADPSNGEMHRTVHVAELPTGDDAYFRDSSYFRRGYGHLPAPDEVRKRGQQISGSLGKYQRPPPVRFEEQRLLVKYGSAITVAEAQCLWYFHTNLNDEVPVPELYGWRRDGDEVFIYMELVDGDTLEARWPALSQEERTSICQQLRKCIESWRKLRQETEPYFIGQIGRQGVGDVIFSDHGDAGAGPFESLTRFHDFFARYSCRRHPEWDPRREFPELVGLTDDRPTIFTHADLDRSNIIISPQNGDSPPQIVAIIDWHQSGWYPDGWEWMKAEWRCDPLPTGGRDTAWLREVLTPADDDYVLAWEFVTNSW